MKRILLCILSLVLMGCGGGSASGKGFEIISQEIAHEIMQKPGDYVVVDVREREEYDAGHIPNAVLVPLSDLEKTAKIKLPDKNKELLIYCRSGRRSKIAAERLAKLGYGKIKEFGGIIDWKYEIVK